MICDKATPGLYCSRTPGHEGPCASVEYEGDKKFVERGMRRIRDAEDAARWNAWASGMVEACNSDEQEPAFLVALDKAIGDTEPPITLELLNEWTDAAIKQGASHDR